MPTELLEQFNWTQQVPLTKGDTLIGVKVLHQNLTGNQLQYLIIHYQNKAFTKVVMHQIQYAGLIGKSTPLRITSKNFNNQKSATALLAYAKRDSLAGGIRSGTTRKSLVTGNLPMVTVYGEYTDSGIITFSPTTCLLLGGAFGSGGQGNGGDTDNGLQDPYTYLDYLDPMYTPNNGGGGSYEILDLTYNRVIGGIKYNIAAYPYKDKGFPWFWMDDPTLRNADGYLYANLAALYDELKQNPSALINCAEVQALIAYGPMFQKVSTFKAPESIINRLNEVRQIAPNFIVDNFNIQSLEDASGSVVNCDFFPVQIKQLPTGFTAVSLLEYFRTHINEFISPSQDISFTPYQNGSFNDAVRFFSPYDASVGALVHIDMLNDGSVILSDYQRNTYSAGNQWNKFTFSTVETPLDFEHPVAGNRQFGIYSNPTSPNEFTFYIMGVDRMWDVVTELGDFLTPINGFKDADDLWSNIQANFIQFVNNNGGESRPYTPNNYISRPNWSAVDKFLKGEIDLQTFKSSIGC